MVALVILLGGLLTGLIDSLIALPVFVIAVALLRNSSLSPSLKNHLLLGLTALASAAYCTVIHPSAGLSFRSLGLFSSALLHKPKLGGDFKKMRKIFVINLLISMLFLSLVFIFNSNLPIRINDENIDNYQHNILTDLNKLDFRHWAITLFNRSLAATNRKGFFCF